VEPEAADLDEEALRYSQSQSQDSDEEDEDVENLPLSQDSNADELLDEIKDHHTKGCPCKRGCPQKLSVADIYKHVLNMRSLEKNEKEMYIGAAKWEIIVRTDQAWGQEEGALHLHDG